MIPNLEQRMQEMLYPDQLEAVEKIRHSRGGAVWWDVGLGKTRIAIFTFAVLQEIYQWSVPSVCLVICKPKTFRDWREEIGRCIPEAAVYENTLPAHPPGSVPCFLLMSFALLVKEVASLQDDWRIRFVVYDESWLYANPKSARSKAAKKLSVSKKAMDLSGTVMKAGDISEVYAQLEVIHKHRHAASSMTQFRTKYQTVVVDQERGFRNYYQKKGAFQKLMADIDPVVSVNRKKGERKIHDQYHNIDPTKQQEKYFEELREYYSIDDLGLEFNNALAVITKAQQVSDGWIADGNGDIIHIPTNKPNKLSDELEDIIASGQTAVVWCAFRYDLEFLRSRLPFATMQMRGGQEFDVDRWNAGDIRVCLATEASGEGINHFAQTQYAIYYSGNFKWKDMQQSRGRTDRRSSLHGACFYKYLQVDGSFDAHVYQSALASGEAEARLLLQAGLKDWLTKKKRNTR